MSIALVQDTVYRNPTGAGTLTVAYGATTNATSLDTLHGSLVVTGSVGPSGVTDTSGGTNTWNVSSTASNKPPTGIISGQCSFAAWTFATAAITSVTVTATGLSFANVAIGEWSGAASADTGAGGNGTVSGGDASASLTLAQSGELVLLACDPALGSFSGAPSQATQFAGGTVYTCYALSQSGSQTYTWTGDATGGDAYTIAVMAFAPPATNVTSSFGLAMAPLKSSVTAAEVISSTFGLAMAPLKEHLTAAETGANISASFTLAMAPLKMTFNRKAGGGPEYPYHHRAHGR